MHVAREQGLRPVALEKVQQPGPTRLGDVVEVLVLARLGEERRIVGAEEEALPRAGRLGQLGFQPGLLFGLVGEARIDDLRIDEVEPAVPMLEGLVVGAEVPVPEFDEFLANDAPRPPDDGLVTDVVVSGSHVERMTQPRRRPRGIARPPVRRGRSAPVPGARHRPSA